MNWPNWTGRTVVCVATGPSLTREQVELAASSSAAIIAVNDAGIPGRRPFSISRCDLWYAADVNFWQAYSVQAQRSEAIRACAEKSATRAGLAHLFLDTRSGKRSIGFAAGGMHSGYQALQVAINSGASVVLLLGYDCKPSGARTNYFGVKPYGLHQSSPYRDWVPEYRKLDVPHHCNVVNCTPGSAIDAFPFGNIETLLERRTAA